MADVVLTSALRSNLLALQLTQSLIDSTQIKLSTGKKVNSALDNPQSYFAAQSLSNRAKDLGGLLDGIGQSIRTIQEADKGVSSLTTLVEQANSVAQEAFSEVRSAQGYVSTTGTKDLRGIADLTAAGNGIATGADLVLTWTDGTTTKTTGDVNIAASSDVYDLVAAINGNATTKDYIRASIDASGRLKLESLQEGGAIRIGEGTTAITSAGFSTLGLSDVVGTEYLDNVAGGRQGGTLVSGRTITSAKTGGTAVGGEYLASDTFDTANYIATGDSIEVTIQIDGKSSSTHTVADTDSIQELLDKINTDTNVNEKVTASFNTTSGKIEFKFADSVGQAEIVLGASAASDVASFGFGTGAGDATFTAGTDNESEIFTFVGTSANLTRYTDNYNSIRSQIDDLVQDAHYRGVSLLNGVDLTTYFNEDRSSSLTTTGQDLSAAGLGLSQVNFITAGNVQAAIDATTVALDTVRNFGATLSNDLSIIQTRQNFTKETINTLQAGSDDLTLADQNEEGAKLLSLQTRQQLGVTALSLAAQSQQAILRLF